MAQGGTKSSRSESASSVDININTPDIVEVIQDTFGTMRLDDPDQRLRTRDARYESQIVTGYLRKANDAVTVLTAGFSEATVQLSGSWIGQLAFEVTLDGTAWYPLVGMQVSPPASGPVAFGLQTTVATQAGIYKFGITAMQRFRVRATTELPKFTVSVTILLSAGPATFDVSATVLATSLNMPIQQEPITGHLFVSDVYMRQMMEQLLIEAVNQNLTLSSILDMLTQGLGTLQHS